MALLTPDQNPSITDTVLFNINTPGADGCFTANPYMVNSLVIYFAARDFAANDNDQSYTKNVYDPAKVAAAAAAKQLACVVPTPENIANAQLLQAQATQVIASNTFYYNEAKAVAIIGTPDFPAWLSSDIPDAQIANVPTDSNGNPQYGYFTYEWNPEGQREGDYFACWTWTPLPAGDTLSAFIEFTLIGDTKATTSIPTHVTTPGKYDLLLDRYLPEMFKMYLGTGDLSPTTIQQYQAAIAQNFTDIENLGNQLQDLTDANATQEAFLPLLADNFNLRLRSDDPTLWRRQIRRAVPLYKMKGTFAGLAEAFANSGMHLVKFTKLWQMVSLYTWTDGFEVMNGQKAFVLSKTALPVDPANFTLSIRRFNTTTYTELSSNCVTFSTVQGVTTMNWVGNSLLPAITLNNGDRLLVLYLVHYVPNPTQQNIENYVRTLPLADQRDETLQMYPLKNWNVRVIAQDDPLFDIVIPDRNPFHNPLIYGKVRTEFPYSENAFNMDEYNGSTRNSLNPCDIDKDFLDACRYCQSSKYNLEIDIEELSNNRIAEALDVITEYTPFHAVLQSLIFNGRISEFMAPPLERIVTLISFVGEDDVVAGAAQMVFNRVLPLAFTQVKRDMLAELIPVVINQDGTGFNNKIIIYSDNANFDQLALDFANNVLEILAPSVNAGFYRITETHARNIAVVSGAIEPINTAAFTFRLSNILYQNNTAILNNANLVTLGDAAFNYGELDVQSEYDGDMPWFVSIPAYAATPYVIKDIMPDGTLLLADPLNTLPTSNINDVAYSLLNSNLVLVIVSDTGAINVQIRGLVQAVNDLDIKDYVKVGYYVLYEGVQYLIADFPDGTSDQFYILGYSGGEVAGASITVYQRQLNNSIGQFGYHGLTLRTLVNQETILGINNGDNPPPANLILENSHFKENYLVVIGCNYYIITDINGINITLNGPFQDWTTLGTVVQYSIYRYKKLPKTIEGEHFNFYDRRGKELIDATKTIIPMMHRAHALNAINRNETREITEQQESITFEIEWAGE